MKDRQHVRTLFLAITLGLTSACCAITILASDLPAQARGGGGGGHGGGGGFHGGGGEFHGGGGGEFHGGGGGEFHGGGGGEGAYHGAGFEGGGDGWGVHGGAEEIRSGGNEDAIRSGGFGGAFRSAGAFDRGYGAGGAINPYTEGHSMNEATLRSAADHEYGTARAEGLSTDGGFGRLASESAGASLGRFAGASPGSDLGRLGQTHPETQASLMDYGVNVRSNWANGNHPTFDRAWWGRHNGWWGYGGWGDPWWGGVGWDDLANWWGVPDNEDPVEYDYGNNIIYQGDQVYYGTQPMATTIQYYQQAQALANAAPPIPTTTVNGLTQITGDWKPLGVFSLTKPGDTNSTTIFQLAINRAGDVSGNYYNTINNQSTPIKGKVDKKTMRLAFTVGKNKDVVYDTGLGNLLSPQSPILVHFNKSQTQQAMMVRLDKPKS